MNAPAAAIRDRIQRCLAGNIPLDDLYAWITQVVSDADDAPSAPGKALAYDVLNLFYEADAAEWSDDDLRAELRAVAVAPSLR